jgi:hypothetical protein
MSLATYAVETIKSRAWRSRTKPPKWVGEKVFECANSVRDPASAAAWAESWAIPGSPGLFYYPTGVEVQPHTPRTGRATIIVSYETYYDPQAFPTDRASVAYLSVKVSAEYAKRTEAKLEQGRWSGQTVDLIGEPDAEGDFWRQTFGSRTQRVVTATIALNTAIKRSDFSLGAVLAYEPCVNATTFFGLEAETLLLAGVEVPKAYVLMSESPYIPLSYILEYQAGGWNGTCGVQRYSRISVVEEKRGYSYGGTSGNDLVLSFVNDKGDEVEKADAAKVTVTKNLPWLKTGTDGTFRPFTVDQAMFSYLKGLLWWM